MDDYSSDSSCSNPSPAGRDLYTPEYRVFPTRGTACQGFHRPWPLKWSSVFTHLRYPQDYWKKSCLLVSLVDESDHGQYSYGLSRRSIGICIYLVPGADSHLCPSPLPQFLPWRCCFWLWNDWVLMDFLSSLAGRWWRHFCMPFSALSSGKCWSWGKLYTSCVDRESITTTVCQLTDRFCQWMAKTYKQADHKTKETTVTKHNLFLGCVEIPFGQVTPDKLVSFLESEKSQSPQVGMWYALIRACVSTKNSGTEWHWNSTACSLKLEYIQLY